MKFLCNICQSTTIGRRMYRDDGAGVLFCANCGMGAIEEVPQKTDHFYDDGYYNDGSNVQTGGYHNYPLTATHTQAWVNLMVGALRPQGGRILDVGCATVLLSGLPANFKLFGIEVNGAAAAAASLPPVSGKLSPL